MGQWTQLIADTFADSADSKRQTAKACCGAIEQAATVIADTFRRNNKVLLCGNGGSAADSQHIATEFIIRLSSARERRSLPALALTTDSSALTAATNDYGMERMFARQIEGLGNAGDVLIGITTSGNSPNILEAFKTAKERGLYTIALLGGAGGKCRDQTDLAIIVPANTTNRIQENHITIGHIICDIVERMLFDV